MYNIDGGYLEVGKEYILQWLKTYDEELEISDEAIEYIVQKGGNGFCELEENVQKLLSVAKKSKIQKITKDFVEQLL